MTNTSENPEPTAPQPSPRSWMRAAAWRKRVVTHEYYRGLDATAREGISDDDYATTMATLEAMARNLGWDESQGMPGQGPAEWRGHGPHRGYGYGRGYGRGGCGERRGEQSAKSDKAARKAEKKASSKPQQAAS